MRHIQYRDNLMWILGALLAAGCGPETVTPATTKADASSLDITASDRWVVVPDTSQPLDARVILDTAPIVDAALDAATGDTLAVDAISTDGALEDAAAEDAGVEMPEDPAAPLVVEGSAEASMSLLSALGEIVDYDQQQQLGSDELGVRACPEISSEPGLNNGWRLEYGDGCYNDRRKFLTGHIVVQRLRQGLLDPYLEISFYDHKRGLLDRNPTYNGTVLLKKQGLLDSDYIVYNHPEHGQLQSQGSLQQYKAQTLRVKVGVHGRLFKIDLGGEQDSSLSLSASATAITLVGSVTLDEIPATMFYNAEFDGRVRQVQTADYNADTGAYTSSGLQFPRRSAEEGCDCPKSGAFTMSGESFFDQTTIVATLTYNRQSPQLCQPATIQLVTIIGDRVERVETNVEDPFGLFDLQALIGLCAPETERKYRCDIFDNEGPCESWRGSYQMAAHQALFYTAGSGNRLLPDSLEDGTTIPKTLRNEVTGARTRQPLNLCSESVAAAHESLSNLAMTLELAGNCAARFMIQEYRGTSAVGPLRALCGKFQDRGQGDFDLVLDESFGLDDPEDGLDWIFQGGGALTAERTSGGISFELTKTIDSDDRAGQCLETLSEQQRLERARQLAKRRCLDTHFWNQDELGSGEQVTWTKVWDVLASDQPLRTCLLAALDNNSSAADAVVDDLKDKIAALDGDSNDLLVAGQSIPRGDNDSNIPVRQRLRNLLMNSDEADAPTAALFPAQPDPAGQQQVLSFQLIKNNPDCQESSDPCASAEDEDDIAQWPNYQPQAPGMLANLDLRDEEQAGRRLWHLATGRVTVEFPDIDDLVAECNEYVAACQLVVSDPNNELRSMLDVAYRDLTYFPSINDEHCLQMQQTCDRIEDAAANMDNLSWWKENYYATQAFTHWDPSALDWSDSDCMDLEDMDNPQKPTRTCGLSGLYYYLNHLPDWVDVNADRVPEKINYDFARATIIDTTEAGLPGDMAIAVKSSGSSETWNLIKSPTFHAAAEWIEDSLVGPYTDVDHIDPNHVDTFHWASANINDSSDQPVGQAPFAWQQQAKFTFNASASDDLRIPEENVSYVHAPKALNVCRPRSVILDNVYFPTIRWNGYYGDPMQWLSSVRNDNLPVDQQRVEASPYTSHPGEDGYLYYFEMDRPELANMMYHYTHGQGASSSRDLSKMHFVSLFLTTSKVVDLDHWFGVRCPTCGDVQNNNDYRAVPDMGLFTQSNVSWFDLAPTGRDYMRSPQPIIDYVLHVAVSRSSRRHLSASDLYGPVVPPELANDSAVVVSVHLVYRPTIVINSDLFPGGNLTHFWRRDIFGALVQNPCE